MVQRFGHTVVLAQEQKLLTPIETIVGSFIYLSYKGRATLGFTARHKPPPWTVETHIYRRRVIRHLEAEGYICSGWFSKTLLLFEKESCLYYVAAKHDGYTARGVRRMLSKLRQQLNQHDKLLVFTPKPNQLVRLARRHPQLKVKKLKHA